MNAGDAGLVCLDAVGNWSVCVAWCHGSRRRPLTSTHRERVCTTSVDLVFVRTPTQVAGR